MPLSPDQISGLHARFPHFDAERAAPLFHSDQSGRADVAKKHETTTWPAVLMKNGVQWFYDREQRHPKHKSWAPAGGKTLLSDDPQLSGPAFTIVEGEADAVALLSVGMPGVVCIGGTDQAAEFGRHFKGKTLYVLFDGDDAGRAGARAFALAALSAGALRVNVGALPEGEDPESFTAKQPTPQAAAAAITKMLGNSEPVGARELREAQRDADAEAGFKVVPTWAARVQVAGQTTPTLIVSVLDSGMERPELAVYGPLTFGGDAIAAPVYPGMEKESLLCSGVALISGASVGWRRFSEGFRIGERQTVYEPAGCRDDLASLFREGTFILPPFPAEAPPDPEQLVERLGDYFARWLHATPETYHVLAAYVLACWRLEDARFAKAPFLRFHGRSGSGKSTGVLLAHHVAPFSLYAAGTSDNLHRIVEAFGEFTLAWDEFNPQNLSRDGARKLVNTLNLSQNRAARELRVEKGRGKDAPLEVRAFRLFGPKVFSGYLPGEDDGLRRRTIGVDMDAAGKAPREKRFSQLPAAALSEAMALRGDLLAWRAAELHRGEVDSATDETHAALLDAGVENLLDCYWPLLYALPAEAAGTRRVVLEHALAAEAAWAGGRTARPSAFLLEALADCFRSTPLSTPGGSPVVRVEDLVTPLRERFDMRWDAEQIAVALRNLGAVVKRPYLAPPNGGKAVKTSRLSIVLAENAETLSRLMDEHGIEWDPALRVSPPPYAGL
jgi:hypothetical protein